MWTSLCNFFCNKFFSKPELEFQRSNDSCSTVNGKRLKLVDRLWNSRGLLNRTNSSSPYSMQKEHIDISDEEDCCIIAEIPRRKKAGNSTTEQKVTDQPLPGKSLLPICWSSFSFRKDPPPDKKDKDEDIKEVKIVNKFSVKDENAKVQPKKFFTSQRASISQGKLARSRLSYKNYLRKKMNLLQESYRLTEKFQYMQLLQSHTTYKLMTVRKPLKSIKGPNEQIEIVDLSDDDLSKTQGSTMRKHNTEEQDVQIVEEVPGVKSFQDVLKLAPINVDIELNGLPNHCKSNPNALRLSKSSLALVDYDSVDPCQKAEALEEKLRDFMQISGPSIRELENREPNYLPELKPEQERKIKNALSPEPSGEILSEDFGIQITRLDMQTLVGLNWLNDEIINFYMNLIMERSKLNRRLPRVYAFNTFFYPKLVSDGYTNLRRWTKKVDVFSFDLILVPVHLGMHWCLSVIDFRLKTVKYYDSVGAPNDACLERLLLYLKAESMDKKKKTFFTTDWQSVNVDDIPQQMNGSDCGVFCCMFAEHLARDRSILFSQADMPYFRKKMVIEILEKKLLT